MKTILKPIQKHRQTYERRLSEKKPVRPKTLNLKLLSNPFIKDQEHYKAICNELGLYNKRILENLISDQYEASSHQKLFSIFSDLANIQTRQDMITRLQQTWNWWIQQRRKIKQRKQLGVVKYKTDRHTDKIKDALQKMHHSEVVQTPQNLPTEIRYNQVLPFQMRYRTSHKQMDIPLKRLTQYKRKIINISDTHIFDHEEAKSMKEKVLYPRPKKYVPPEQTHEPNPQNATSSQNPQTEVQAPSAQNVQAANNTNPQNAAGAPPTQDPNKPPEAEDPNQQDLGMGLGEQAGDAQEEAGQQQALPQDRLAPKNKIYKVSNRQIEQYNKMKTYQKPYMFYRGRQSLAQRRMEQRAVLKQQYSLQIQREQQQMIAKAHEWGMQKEMIAKQRQLLLQMKLTKPTYTLSYQEPQKKEMLSVADEKKYGFYVPPKPISLPQIQLDDKLPILPQFRAIQKDARKDRLNSLRHKFGNILKLRDRSSEGNGVGLSLCQTSPRRRDLSMILNQHSPERYKEIQLEQIQKIKQSLGKQRININIKTLAQALVPGIQEYKQQQFQSPSKMLPNNPFFVQPKKKKKK